MNKPMLIGILLLVSGVAGLEMQSHDGPIQFVEFFTALGGLCLIIYGATDMRKYRR